MKRILFLLCVLVGNVVGLEENESFPIVSGLGRLQGKIVDGKYHSPKNIFSCKANDFGEGIYISEDGLLENGVCVVAFYNAIGHFQKAEMVFLPGLQKKLNDDQLEKFFCCMGVGILEEVSDAKGIKILQKEAIGKGLFYAISIKSMAVFNFNGKATPVVRGYLAYQEKDKLVLLSNQQITSSRGSPKRLINKLRKELIEFKNTFRFNTEDLATLLSKSD